MTAVRPRNMRLILVVVFLVLTPACSTSGTESRTPKGENTAATSVGPVLKQGFWTRLPDSPLSPRERPAAAYVDGEIVVVGGYSGPPCPPGADCARPVDAVERDGAAYDLRTESWRRIADAPRPVPELASTAVIGERMYVLADGALLAWDSATDSWDKILPPPVLCGGPPWSPTARAWSSRRAATRTGSGPITCSTPSRASGRAFPGTR